MSASFKSELARGEFTLKNNVFYPNSKEMGFADFETSYSALRRKEGRLLDDEVVKRLPEISKQNPLYREWSIRKNSWKVFRQYLVNLSPCQTILEIGCGNGWMTKELGLPDKEVCAIDVHEAELLQAARLFASDRISFVYGNLFHLPLPKYRFDLVLLASSIQYFEDLPKLIHHMCSLTRKNGEIHILDSPLYDSQEVTAAQQRSLEYFTAQGEPGMNKHYFHHSLDALRDFHWTFLQRPHRTAPVVNRLLNRSPFPWIKILADGTA